MIPNSRWCDCNFICDDEGLCNKFEHVYRCQNSTVIISGHLMCNEMKDCPGGDDESGCPDHNNPELFCKFSVIVGSKYNETMVLNNYTRCFSLPWIICDNKLDQTNCFNNSLNEIRCLINGSLSSVSKNIICKPQLRTRRNEIHQYPGPVCDNRINDVCVTLSGACIIHKHQLCDGITDCPI